MFNYFQFLHITALLTKEYQILTSISYWTIKMLKIEGRSKNNVFLFWKWGNVGAGNVGSDHNVTWAHDGRAGWDGGSVTSVTPLSLVLLEEWAFPSLPFPYATLMGSGTSAHTLQKWVSIPGRAGRGAGPGRNSPALPTGQAAVGTAPS